MRKKISTTIYVTLEQSEKLKVLHERTKVPVSVYIREGIDLVLRHYAHMMPGQLELVAEPEEATFNVATPPPPEVQSSLPSPAPRVEVLTHAPEPLRSSRVAGGGK